LGLGASVPPSRFEIGTEAIQHSKEEEGEKTVKNSNILKWVAPAFGVAVCMLLAAQPAAANGCSWQIDLKPCSDPNSVNSNSGGVVPVLILGSTDCDVTDVDDDSQRLGVDAGAPGPDSNSLAECVVNGGIDPRHDLTDPAVVALHIANTSTNAEDCDNADAFPDFISHHRAKDIPTLDTTDTSLCLWFTTNTGTGQCACDTVNVVK
jgi:hypothetical protein